MVAGIILNNRRNVCKYAYIPAICVDPGTLRFHLWISFCETLRHSCFIPAFVFANDAVNCYLVAFSLAFLPIIAKININHISKKFLEILKPNPSSMALYIRKTQISKKELIQWKIHSPRWYGSSLPRTGAITPFPRKSPKFF